MISREHADACLEEASVDLKAMSYEDLETFAESHSMFDGWQSREIQVDGTATEVFILAGQLGRINKRISIEITLSSVGEEVPEHTYCVYFERYKSGRFYPSPREEEREATLVKALPYALIGIVVIGLLALVWHLFLRGG